MKACDINNQMSLFLQIPQDIPEIEDANYAGSEFAQPDAMGSNQAKKPGTDQQPQTQILQNDLRKKSYNMKKIKAGHLIKVTGFYLFHISINLTLRISFLST